MGAAVAQRIDDARLRGRRTFDERLLVRFPSLFGRVARVVLARPATSRVRRALIRRSLVSGWAAVNRGDFDLMLVRYAPDIVYESQAELVTLGLPAEIQGKTEWTARILEFYDAWERWRYGPMFVIDTGQGLVSLGRFEARGKASGAESQLDYAQLIELEDGFVSHERDFSDWSQALTVGGLDPKVVGRLEALAPGESMEL